ncbi:MAG: hypothetical protein K1X74_05765 [Pirellulales bacterium]|nr:hypothetical protein [Pirellulales bacterium]
MRKFALALFSLGMMLFMPAASVLAQDDEMKPLVVLWAKSYEELIKDIDFMGKASDNPDLGQGLEGLINLVSQGQGLPGLDKSKPWGAAVNSDGFQFQILGFLPIKELDKFMEMVGQLAGAPEKQDDGSYKINVQAFALYLKQVGDWTFVSQAPEGFASVPADPAKLLGGLNEKYDFGVQAHIQNIPEVFRQLAVEQIKLGMDEQLKKMPQESDAQYELRKQLTKDQLDKLTSQMDEMEQITFGVNIDEEKELGLVDVTMLAVAGSKTAERMAKMSDGKTNFAGFNIADAKASLNMNLVLSQDDIAEMRGMVDSMQAELDKQVEGLDVIPDEAIRTEIKELVGELFDIVKTTVDSGRTDAGMALVGEGPHTLLAGGYIADGEVLKKWFERLVSMAETEAGFYGVQMDVAKHEGVAFHTVSIPFVGGDEMAPISELFGDELELVIGIGEKSAYMALGKDGVDQLKKVIDDSKAAADKKVPPIQGQASVGLLVKLLASQQKSGGSEAGDPLVDALTMNIPEKDDKVTMIAEPIENGIKLHIEAQKGVLGFLTSALMAAAPSMNIPGLGQ